MSQVRIKNATKTYDVNGQTVRAVDDASLDIQPGDFISIVGHSGSGKTTLLSLIGGIVKPTSGSVLYNGTDISGFSSDRISEYRCDTVGLMFQFSSLLPTLTVKENLLLPSMFSAKNKQQGTTTPGLKAIELLHLVGLGDKVNAYPFQLSGGQQRRVAIARAFMNEPELILADEPTGDLDEETEAEMMELFRIMNKEKNITFIMVTHNTELAHQAGRQMRMNHGMLEREVIFQRR